MKLLTLRLENFMSARSQQYDFCGRSASIYGANYIGKSTVGHAITWLLFGQPNHPDAKGFSPKTIIDGKEAHGLDHAVTASFACENGSHIELRRVYHEVYTKKRGSTHETFTGHTTEYYVDGVPVSEKEYTGTLERLCGSIESMRMIMMPDYFAHRMDWKARRALLLEICGDISDNDVIDATPKLKEIRSVLKKPGDTDLLYTVDEYRAIAQRGMADVNKKLQSIPARIDEAQRAIPDMSGSPSLDSSEKEVEKLRAEIMKVEDAQRSGNSSARELAREALLSAKNNLLQAKQNYESAEYEKAQSNRDALQAETVVVTKLRRELTNAEDKLELLKSHRDKLSDERYALMEQYKEVLEQVYHGDDTCPTCGQTLPADQIAAAVEAFNLARSKKLEAINHTGKKCSKDVIADANYEIEDQESIVQDAKSALSIAEKRLEIVRNEIAYEPVPFDATDEYRRLHELVLEAEMRLQDAERPTEQEQSYEQTITSLRESQRSMERICSMYHLKEAQEARIEELGQEEKNLSAQYEVFEHGISLCDLFTRSKVSMLTERINERFKSVSFILFKEQINGGLQECCEVAVPDLNGSPIPYLCPANTAAHINAGLEIIAVLSEHFGISLPVILDNAESITHPRSDGIEQLIRLVVSADDTQLRFEVDDELQKMAG